MAKNVRHTILAVAHYMLLKRDLTPPYTQGMSAAEVVNVLREAAMALGCSEEVTAVVIPFQQRTTGSS